MLRAMLKVAYIFLMHVVVMCLGHRKGGYDVATDYQMSAIAALVLNLKFNFSAMISNNLKGNLGDKKLIVYPGFLQLLIDFQALELEKEDGDSMKLEHMNSATFERLGAYTGKVYNKIPKFR
ncbi:hypothetical protein Hanom_Chr16g01462871 [Helianthus anomalus]